MEKKSSKIIGYTLMGLVALAIFCQLLIAFSGNSEQIYRVIGAVLRAAIG